ncbi:MAG TPA: hypothetical protein VLE69_01600 [Candidatus Saccharimonadales bacterium]|nr:hypothetical protein [Candidatus Saccharimonadales bacterium]
MRAQQTATKQAIIALYIALSVAYLTIALFLPPDKKALAKYQISPSTIKALSLVVALPLVAIWGVGFYGFYRYDSYADTISKTKDGKYHRLIASGLFLLALSLPVSSILSNLLSYYGRVYQNFMPSSVIIGNYVTIALYLSAFAFIYKGATGLLQITQKTMRQRGEIYLMMGFTVVVGIFYYLSLHNPARQFPTGNLTTAAYYLPDWLIILTVLLPYTLMWFLGVMAAYRLWLYRNNVAGKIYKSAFTRVAIGLGMVVALLMILRYLTALITILDKLTIKYLLLVVYLLLIFIAVGYIFIAIGAKRLKKIEEV